MNRGKLLIKNTLLLTLGWLMPRFISVITLPIVTSKLSTSEYGVYDLILSVISLLIPIVSLQIQQAAFRYLLTADNEVMIRKYLNSVLQYLAMSMSVVAFLGAAALFIFDLDYILLIRIFLLLVFESCYIITGQLLRGMGRTDKYVSGVILYALCNMIFLLIFVLLLDMTLNGVLMSMLLSYFLTSAYMLSAKEIRYRLGMKYFSWAAIKEMLAFSAPLVPSTVSLWVVSLSDRFVIVGYMGAGMNGIYSVANKIPALFSTCYNMFNMAWTESASRAADDSDQVHYYSDMFDKLFGFLIGMMLCLIAVTPVLFKLLIDEKYGQAYYQMPILFFGVFFNSIVSFYGSIYIALKDTKVVAFTSLSGAIINLLINILFINQIGLYAASISTAVSYLFITLYRSYDINKHIKLKYNFKKIIVGMFMFMICSSLCYLRQIWSLAACFAVAVAYNLIVNLYMLKLIIGLIKKRRG